MCFLLKIMSRSEISKFAQYYYTGIDSVKPDIYANNTNVNILHIEKILLNFVADYTFLLQFRT